ncbi:MAG: hypothetical protein IPK60_07850 [Sandaracinaceae bacterium]|nr:hypothetical protein [Sandaracinaceae bacterium]
MSVERGWKARFRYRADEFLGGGAGKQLAFLFALTCVLVIGFTLLSMITSAVAPGLGIADGNILDRAWWYFTRLIDAGTMGGDGGNVNRLVSTSATVLGVVVAGLLISSLAGNFQERLDAIKRGGAPVMEEDHFLILGWSEKIFSVIDQISEAYATQKIVCVVMAEGEKSAMEEELRDKVVHQDRVKIVVRSGSSVSLNDLARVSFAQARAIVVLVDAKDVEEPNRADGRIIKTLLALYNHPEGRDRAKFPRVTAEVMIAENQEIASIAANGRAQVVRTNEMISKIILQTSRIGGLSVVYDELLRFEGNEIHYKALPQVVGRRFADILLDFPNALVVGTAKADGSSHQLNPAADYIIQPGDELLLLAEDSNIKFQPYAGPLRFDAMPKLEAAPRKPMEHMLVLGWNEKLFPIIQEYDNYVGEGSSLTLVNSLPRDVREKRLKENVGELKNVQLRHVVGEFTSRALMEQIQPQRYPTVMVLGDSVEAKSAEDADTRAIIALLLLRDARRRHGVPRQEVCSEILDPKNRELAATTEINDIVISNEMVSMVLAQITYEPRVRAVLEDLFESDGSEIYLKPLAFYVPPGNQVTFEYLVLAAKARGEVVMGVQRYIDDPSKRFGLLLNPIDRHTPFTASKGDRLVVLAEDDG